MFLQDVRGVAIHRLGGTPFEFASRSFPDVHDETRSFLSPGALIRLAEDAGIGPQASGSASGGGTAARKSRSERRKELRWARSHPGTTPTPAAGSSSRAAGVANGSTPLLVMGALEGSEAILKSGASVEEAAKEYSRQAVTAAMGRVRARILAEGLCGAPSNGSSCVGSWCLARGTAKEWGILGGKAVVGPESDGPRKRAGA